MRPSTPTSQVAITSWNDEMFILLLEDIIHGSPLPGNVVADINPYKCLPSNLPDGIGYFIGSEVKKDLEHGCWKAKGEPCKIYTDSVVTGWRTIFEFYEGRGPDEQRTDWMIKEYKITRKGLYNNNNTKDYGSLCRLLKNEEHIPNLFLYPNHGGALLKAKRNTGEESTNRAQKKNKDYETKSLTGAEGQDCFQEGDFLELDDLIGSNSRHSSSENSSCSSFTSDELFDSSLLLRELDDKKTSSTDESFKHTISTCVEPNEVMLRAASAEEVTQKLESKKEMEEVFGSQAASFHQKANKEKRKKAITEGRKKLKKYGLMPFGPF